MTSAPTIPMSATPVTTVEDPRRVLRLRLKPKAATTGFVDGGWWPRSRDLAVELPGLLAVLAVRLGRIERVSYHLGDWDPIPARLTVEGRVVRLGGYRAQHASTSGRTTQGECKLSGESLARPIWGQQWEKAASVTARAGAQPRRLSARER